MDIPKNTISLNEKNTIKEARICTCVSQNLKNFSFEKIYTVNISKNEYDYTFALINNSNEYEYLNETEFNNNFKYIK